MKTNCKEVETETKNSFAVVEIIDEYEAENYISNGSKNVVGIYRDSKIYESITTCEELDEYVSEEMEIGIIKYYEYR